MRGVSREIYTSVLLQFGPEILAYGLQVFFMFSVVFFLWISTILFFLMRVLLILLQYGHGILHYYNCLISMIFFPGLF